MPLPFRPHPVDGADIAAVGHGMAALHGFPRAVLLFPQQGEEEIVSSFPGRDNLPYLLKEGRLFSFFCQEWRWLSARHPHTSIYSILVMQLEGENPGEAPSTGQPTPLRGWSMLSVGRWYNPFPGAPMSQSLE